MERVGGKAHGLCQLVSWGFHVPDAYVIPAEVYREVVESGAVAKHIDSGPELTRIRHAIQQSDFDHQLDTELREVWSALEVESDGPLAVACRSSAIGEDSSVTSFAGQHDTILGITTFEGLVDAVRQCWASAWTDQAAAYRSRSGTPAPDMAVVIQRMARADVSGVAFSLNPVTGDSSHVVINSAYGLGELIVSGSITPDTFVVDRETRAVISSEVSSDKTRMLVLTESGEVAKRQVEPARAMASSLDEQQVAEVAAAALRAEEKTGAPQDIEWAFEGSRLLMLQSRPVTGAVSAPVLNHCLYT